MAQVRVFASQQKKPNQTVLAWLVIVVVGTLCACAYWWGGHTATAKAEVSSGQAFSRVAYLTFDDGPTHSYTAEVLDDLNAFGDHATFFQIGRNMAGNEALMRRMLDDGNQLGTHSWDHPLFTKLSADQVDSEVSRARDLQVRILGGYDSRLFRYPYDRPSEAGMLYLGQQHMFSWDAGINVEDWNWRKVSDAQVIRGIMAQLHPGAIIQLHDGQDIIGRNHPSYLPGLLRALHQRGYATDTLPSQGYSP
jgi:peptidoglycan/xylan/chitin deacetylase (PgdA/CDA1 family)